MRLLRRSIAGIAVIVIAVLIGFARDTGQSTDTPHTNRPAFVPRAPESVPASAADRRAAVRTLATFTRSAIVRRNLQRSWPLADAQMRNGVSHRDWLAGNLPVPPYNARAFGSAGYTLQYSYRHVLGYDVLILPRQTRTGAASGQQVYSCELHEFRDRWLVDSCYPRKTL